MKWLAAFLLLAGSAHAEVLGFSQLAIPASGSVSQMYVDAVNSTASVALVVPYGVTTSNLYCESDVSPDNGGGTETLTITVQQALAADPTTFSNTTQTCAISDAATACNDTSHTTSFSAGDRVAITVAVTAGTPATTGKITCAIKAI